MIRLLLILAPITPAAASDELIDPTPEEYKSIQTWIPQHCCWTQNCCKKVDEDALIQMPNDMIRVRVTGQVLPMTGWLKDKFTWRCTCDQQPEGGWLPHVKAKTHCVFVQPYGS